MKATTPKSLAMASTHAGMRRILKKHLPPDEYIRKAVIAGVYKGSSDAYEQRNNPKLKKRRNLRTGASVFEFPAEYEIMKLNPIYQEEARITEKDRKKMRKWEEKSGVVDGEKEKKKSMDRFIKDYLRRNSLSQSAATVRKQSNNGAMEEDDDYYTKLLGVAPPNSNSKYSSSSNNSNTSFMAQKSILLDNAYNFALRQYDLMNQNQQKDANGTKTLSEAESVAMVEDILKQEQLEERFKSRKVTEEITDWRKSTSSQKVQEKTGEMADDTTHQEEEGGDEEAPTAPSSTPGIPSILHSKPHTITALTTWSKRLALLPYAQWSVGAVTALDHWIAVDVLGMEELTWQTVLEGGGGQVALTRDIVDTRCALFPETIMSDENDEEEGVDEMYNVMDSEKEKKKKEVEQSIDELLASLGGFDEEEEENEGSSGDFKSKNDGSSLAEDKDGDTENDKNVEQMKLDLQQWRAKVDEDGPYESWDDGKKKEFDAWLEKYVRLLANEEWELQYVDYKETRETLLSSPSKTQDESDEYWNNLRDETQAEIFLQSILDAHKSSSSSSSADEDEDTAAFLSLPYDTQLRQLIRMGTLRPLYDEFMSESSKQQFIQQNIHTLLENVELEHLVYDPKGPITADDIGSELLQGREVQKGARFRIELLKYGTDAYGTSRAERARALYRAWNEHKANRARYEEIMFKKGKIGLKAKQERKD